MSGNDLSDDTTHMPARRRRVDAPVGPCSWCLLGDHDKCTGVACYRCPPHNHPRRPGISGLGEVKPVLLGDGPEGDATAHKPAHTRGGRQ